MRAPLPLRFFLASAIFGSSAPSCHGPALVAHWTTGHHATAAAGAMDPGLRPIPASSEKTTRPPRKGTTP
eukprot:8545857-Prorocentrum_lima.AAC.1